MTTQISGDTGVSQCQPNSVSQDDLQSGVAGKGPAFSAYQSVAQSVPSNAFTKVNLQSEEFDTANCFDTTLSRFTPNVAGYYYFIGSVTVSTVCTELILALAKNNLAVKFGTNVVLTSGNNASQNMSAVIFLNGTTDFVELQVRPTGTSPAVSIGSNVTYFQGFLARAA